MGVTLVLVAAGLQAASGVSTFLAGRASDRAQRVSAAIAVLASAVGLAGVGVAFAGGAPADVRSIAGGIPGGRLSFAVDPLSACFLAPIFVVSALAAVYGLGYWPQSEHPESGRRLRLFTGLLGAGMVILVTARSAGALLIGWEVMAVSAFFLIATEERDERARDAAWTYFVATHIGTLALFALFALLARATGGLELVPLAAAAASPAALTTIFLLALLGFGVKAGLMPLHVWLPAAHANAPSHVSALLSGVMIKMGIYGILRVTALVPEPPLWWGATLIAIGALSGVVGIAASIAQSELKRALAYSSIENIGLIAIGIGVALLGRTLGRPEWVALGLGGALLHVWNHSLFKPLLFFGAGSVLHATGARSLERFGGLLGRMPVTAAAFAIGAAAICALPGFAGCASEWLLYQGLFRGATAREIAPALVASVGIAALALVGALALAGFVRIFATAFLGVARSDAAARAHEATRSMRWAMGVPALLCIAIGVAPGVLAPLLLRAAGAWSGAPLPGTTALRSLPIVGAVGAAALILVLAGGLWIRRRSPERALAAAMKDAPRWVTAGSAASLAPPLAPPHATPLAAPHAAAPEGAVGAVGTWDCGYFDASSPRLQYTATSFAQLLTAFFRFGAAREVRQVLPSGAFPPRGAYERRPREPLLAGFIVPWFSRWADRCSRVRILQRGKVQVYILYILVALLLGIAWTVIAPGSGS